MFTQIFENNAKHNQCSYFALYIQLVIFVLFQHFLIGKKQTLVITENEYI